MMRYVVGFLVTIGLIILLIVLLFSGGSGPAQKVPGSGKPLASYASTDAAVRLTIDGPINAEQNHRQIQITIDRNNSVMNVIQGYNGNVINTLSYSNTQAGYSAFLHSLQLINFTQGDTSNSALKSEAGHCAIGQRYIVQLIQNDQDIQRYWATSCNGPHTYEGNMQLTLELFQQQIPDYQSAASAVGL